MNLFSVLTNVNDNIELFYGMLGPICYIIIALAAYKAAALSNWSRYLMTFGALGSFTSAIIYLFFDQGRDLSFFLVDYGVITTIPAIVMFTIGFVLAGIEIGGLEFGKQQKKEKKRIAKKSKRDLDDGIL
jgi:hypothetical protein